jgi:hypothetical protein
MKNIEQIEFKQLLNKSLEECFVEYIINRNLTNLSNILSEEGVFSNRDKSSFLSEIKNIFSDPNYITCNYQYAYSNKIKPPNKVHIFSFSLHNNSGHQFEKNSVTLQLLIIIKQGVIIKIYTENNIIEESKFEACLFYN